MGWVTRTGWGIPVDIHMAWDRGVTRMAWGIRADIRTVQDIPAGTLRGCRRAIRRALRAAG